jgi:hypothetical protein
MNNYTLQCDHCRQTFTDADALRPWGPDGERICYACLLAAPERTAKADSVE